MPIIKFDVLDSAPPNVSLGNLILDLQRELVNYGFEFKGFGEPAKINRCRSNASGKVKNDVGWYIYYLVDAGIICRYGDWVLGDTNSFDRVNHGFSSADLREVRRLVAEQEQVNKVEQENFVAHQAAEIANSCTVTDTHPYLQKKGLEKAVNVLVTNDLIIIPKIDAQGFIKSLQYIFSDGSKRNLKGGQNKNCFNLIGIKFDDLRIIKSIGIAEGYATGLTVHKYANEPIAVTFGWSSIKSIVEILLHYTNIEKIIIYADNDYNVDGNPGLSAAFDTQKLDRRISVLHPHGIVGTDFNDLYIEKGEQELKNQLGIIEKSTTFKRLGELENKVPQFLIDNILQKDSVTVIYGAPANGKTHVALSMAIACAANKPWYGKEVKNEEGSVLYICGEDLSGVVRRSYAIAAEFGIANINTLNFYVTENSVHFLDVGAVAKVKAEMKILPQKPALIIIDTLNRNMGDGDENSTKDMTNFYNSVDSLRIETGCTVMLVHHTSKDDPTKMRGSTVISGGVQTEILVNKTAENADELGVHFGKVINVSCPKQKGAAEFKELSFVLKTNIYGPYLHSVTPIMPTMFGNTPSKSPAYKLIINALDIHLNLKSNIIELEELLRIFIQAKIEKSHESAFMDELIKNEKLKITPNINKFEIRG